MLCLRFSIDGNAYALEAAGIVEVIPKMPLLRPPGLPDYVPGCFKYRGHIVPVIDINMLCGKKEAADFFSSRIAVIRYSAEHLLGLLVENATETVNIEPETLEDPGVKNEKDPFLGMISTRGNDMVQLINIDGLLPEPVKHLVFTEKGAAT